MAAETLGPILISKPTRILLLLALCLRTNVNAEKIDMKSFCPDGAFVDLTFATWNGTGFLTEFSQYFLLDQLQSKSGTLLGCMCDIEPCVLLCHSPNERNPTVVSEPEHVNETLAKIPFLHSTILFFVWDACGGQPGKYVKRETDEGTNDELYLLKNGSVYGSVRNGVDILRHEWREHCLKQEPNRSAYSVQRCEHDRILHPLITALGVGFFVSVPFLIATIFVYSVLPELKNMHGNTVRCYLCCLLVTDTICATDLIIRDKIMGRLTCVIYGYVTYFSTLSSFLWLNVMCFDMWWRFRGYGSSRSDGKQHERKRFIWYSIYAWGTVTLSVVVCLSLDYSRYLPDSIVTPRFNDHSCWFGNPYASILYFYGPIGVTIVCNVYFFVLMTLKLARHRRNTQRQLERRDSQRHDVNKASFLLHLKLFVIMGGSWMMVMVSLFVNVHVYFTYFTTAMIVLQGVLIFLVFICKKNIWQSLKMRLRCCRNSNDADAPRLSRVQTSSRFLSHNSSVQN